MSKPGDNRGERATEKKPVVYNYSETPTSARVTLEQLLQAQAKQKAVVKLGKQIKRRNGRR